MQARHDLSLAFERLLAPDTASPHFAPALDEDPTLEITVVFTSLTGTRSALRTAGTLAHRLRARIMLVAPQVVPYAFPLTSPPVLLNFTEERLRAIARASPVETTVRIYLCRDREEALAKVLKPRSVVILGGSKRWWPTLERRLARKLRKAGHEVIVTETE
jgi:hypothetical protein